MLIFTVPFFSNWNQHTNKDRFTLCYVFIGPKAQKYTGVEAPHKRNSGDIASISTKIVVKC